MNYRKVLRCNRSRQRDFRQSGMHAICKYVRSYLPTVSRHFVAAHFALRGLRLAALAAAAFVFLRRLLPAPRHHHRPELEGLLFHFQRRRLQRLRLRCGLSFGGKSGKSLVGRLQGSAGVVSLDRF